MWWNLIMAVFVGSLVAVITNSAARSIDPQTGIVGVSVAGVVLEIVIVKFCVTLVPRPLLAVTVPK